MQELGRTCGDRVELGPGVVQHVTGHPHGGQRRTELVRDVGGESALHPTELRSEEHTSELQSLMRISYAVFCLKKKKNKLIKTQQATSLTTTNKLHTAIPES